ncbi:30S ribosomal protein S21 [Thermodesulfobacteriota bacterium]
MEVKVHDNNVEKALKILKRNLLKEGVFKELKNRRFYEKPSVKMKRKQAAARKTRRKLERNR